MHSIQPDLASARLKLTGYSLSSYSYKPPVGQRKTHIASLLRKRRVYRRCWGTLPRVVYCCVVTAVSPVTSQRVRCLPSVAPFTSHYVKFSVRCLYMTFIGYFEFKTIKRNKLIRVLQIWCFWTLSIVLICMKHNDSETGLCLRLQLNRFRSNL
jgi:hypothetical protein